MVTEKDKLINQVTLGLLIKEGYKAKQAAFDASNPAMTATEKSAADTAQEFIKKEFENNIEKQQKEGHNFDGYDFLELRIWAPDIKCAMVQVHDQLMHDYGVFFQMIMSSGLREICRNKLFYVALLVKKMDLTEL